MTPAELAGLDPRKDLATIQAAVQAGIERGQAPTALYAALAQRDPLALVQLVVGPKTSHGPLAIEGALAVVDVLEKAMTPHALYRRLVALADGGALDVLAMAARRHTIAAWLVPLSDVVEGPLRGAEPGTQHLRIAQHHPGFSAVCWAHAGAGHAAALVAVAGELGRPEPAAALLAHDNLNDAARAGARALEANPETELVPLLAAVWGPELDPVLLRLIPELRSRAAATALRDAARGLPRTTQTLDAVLPGLGG